MSKYSKLPEAQDIADGICSRLNPKNELIKIALLKFAGIHSQAALGMASYEVQISDYDEHGQYSPHVNTDSILNAYPLTLIK